MTGLVQLLLDRVPRGCRSRTCSRDGCRVSMTDAPQSHLLVDLDCTELEPVRDGKRCDFLFVADGDHAAWVVPIELKSGAFRGGPVTEQLQGGANAANDWIPAGCSLRFVPILASGRRVRRERLKSLRRVTVTLRGQRRKPLLIRCGRLVASSSQRPRERDHRGCACATPVT